VFVLSGPPVWLHSVDENIFEPLGTSSSLPLPEDMILSEDSSTRDIGDWGELLVKNYLEAVLVSELLTTPQPFYGQDHPGEPVPEENFWTLWRMGRLTEADTPTIRLGATASAPRAHGLCRMAIQAVFRSVILARLLYALPAWWGFAGTQDRQKVCSFLRRSRPGLSTIPPIFYRPDALPAAQPTVSKH